MKHKRIAVIILLTLCIVGNISSQRKVRVSTVINSSEFSLDSIPLGIIPGIGLMGAFGNVLTTIDPTVISKQITVSLPDSLMIDSFTTIGKKILFKTGSSLIWTDNEQQKFDGITFEDSDYKIQSATDTTFYILRSTTCTLLEINIHSKKSIKSQNFLEPPIAAFNTVTGYIVVTLHDILLYDYDKWLRILSHPAKIKCCVSSPYGIFIGTSDALWRLASKDKIELVANGSIEGIFYHNSSIYIVGTNGDLLRMDY